MRRLRLAAAVTVVVIAATPVAFGQSPSTASPGAEGTTAGSGASSQMIQSERDAFAKLEKLGYTEIKNVHSGPEGISAKAKKDGREVLVVVDSGGHVRER
jgi:hypothetical protein